jgi:hypothetical protein
MTNPSCKTVMSTPGSSAEASSGYAVMTADDVCGERREFLSHPRPSPDELAQLTLPWV